MFLKSQCDPPALRRLLANRPPVQANVAALDRDEAGDRAQQRGLACARWPHHRERPSLADLERDVTQHGFGAEPDRDRVGR